MESLGQRDADLLESRVLFGLSLDGRRHGFGYGSDQQGRELERDSTHVRCVESVR